MNDKCDKCGTRFVNLGELWCPICDHEELHSAWKKAYNKSIEREKELVEGLEEIKKPKDPCMDCSERFQGRCDQKEGCACGLSAGWDVFNSLREALKKHREGK
jgi:uncharacterized Zn finger protein (UPF0148 family)